jgi:hypothetical protein
MLLFRNSDQAQGYALAEGESNIALALAAAQNFRDALDARRAAATNHALLKTAHELRDALIAESQRADFFQNEADKLCAASLDLLKDCERLAAENAALRAELDQVRHDRHILAKRIPPLTTDYDF